MKQTCSVEECGRIQHARGLCQRHYDRQRRFPHLPLDGIFVKLADPRNHSEPMPCSWSGEAAAAHANTPIATAESARERDYESHDWPMSDWQPDAEYLHGLTWDDPSMVTDAERRLADWWERDRRIQNAHRLSMMSASLETAAD